MHTSDIFAVRMLLQINTVLMQTAPSHDPRHELEMMYTIIVILTRAHVFEWLHLTPMSREDEKKQKEEKKG